MASRKQPPKASWGVNYCSMRLRQENKGQELCNLIAEQDENGAGGAEEEEEDEETAALMKANAANAGPSAHDGHHGSGGGGAGKDREPSDGRGRGV
eukprot:533772-Pelagomonas_calceolata.AAC.9